MSDFFSRSYDAVIDLSGFVPEHVSHIIERWSGRIGHYVFISTSSVYKTPPPVPYDEKSPRTTTIGVYGGDKARTEDLLLGEFRRATILRPQAVFGPGDAPQALYVLRRLKAGLPVPIAPRSAGKRLNPLYVDDLVSLIIACLGESSVYGRAFNAAGPEITDPAAFGRLVAETSGLGTFRPVVLDTGLSERLPWLGLPWLDYDLVADTAASRSVGGAGTPLEEALRTTWTWANADPARLRPALQRWEAEALAGRAPGPMDEARWAFTDGLRRVPLWNLARRAADAAGLRARDR